MCSWVVFVVFGGLCFVVLVLGVVFVGFSGHGVGVCRLWLLVLFVVLAVLLVLVVLVLVIVVLRVVVGVVVFRGGVDGLCWWCC